MIISCIKTVCFSPTGGTEQVARAVAERLADALGVPAEHIDITLPAHREQSLRFCAGELAVVAVPVYAGRVPNRLLPFLTERLSGGGALAVPVVVYGNRSRDSALIELRDLLEHAGFHTVAGAAFIARHSITPLLAPGRPDAADMAVLRRFTDAAADKIRGADASCAPVSVCGDGPVGPYYTPLDLEGRPAVFLKAKPRTDPEKCTRCGLCAKVCPMGSIDPGDPSSVPGVCIKCQACVKKCPAGAKYFDDPVFLSHVAMVAQNYTRRLEPEIFV